MDDRKSTLTSQRARQILQALALSPLGLEKVLLHPPQPLELAMLHLQLLFFGLQSSPKLSKLLLRSLRPLVSTLFTAYGTDTNQTKSISRRNKDQESGSHVS